MYRPLGLIYHFSVEAIVRGNMGSAVRKGERLGCLRGVQLEMAQDLVRGQIDDLDAAVIPGGDENLRLVG